MPGIGGFFGWKEPPPAAMITVLVSKTVPASVVTRKRGASVVPVGSTASIIWLRWKVGPNGLTCSSRLSTSAWPVTSGKPGMS